MYDDNFVLGIDFGTSGVRAAVVDTQRQVQWSHRADYPQQPQLHTSWRMALEETLGQLPATIRAGLRRIAIDGTSGTVLLCDRHGHPLTPALLYNYACGEEMIEPVRAMAPPHSPALSATSSLSKLLWWQQTLSPEVWNQAVYLLHQADWLSAQLHGQWGYSDYHNSLKLGYDVGALAYPAWLLGQPWTHLLPKVVAPGQAIAPITSTLAAQFDLSPQCQVIAGTTDSIAAFLASGAETPGDGVTSLGSTLAIKLLSHQRIDASQYGIYSHRLGQYWLAGGASNTGGAVLQQFFDGPTLATLSEQINPSTPPDLDYYPLPKPGERFPINDPNLPPRLTPRPADDATFLHGLLLGIARIEKQGYRLLEKLGASPLRQLYTAGGGAKNLTWQTIRANLLQVPIQTAASPEAAVGTAYLAQGIITEQFG
ncbi:MAG: FGGY-family carbohydrate kinase [Leptolyngbyaceae cyanobacterium SM2_5_2]|nr:FGGY-family carbohydrate kinase [Leptolyngbyaceae cyanobacterium SM2_5_2]